MRNVLGATLCATALLLAGCSSSQGLLEIRQAGSSTVEPLALAWAEAFGSEIGAHVVVAGGGSGTGIANFCKGELDIADSSRAMKAEEKGTCESNGVEPFELQVATDALSVVVDTSNTFVECLSIEQLHRIWTADTGQQANRWSDLDPSWPDEDIQLYGPGTNSGTFDYFLEAVIHPFDGKESKGRSDYTPSENDNTLVQGVDSGPHTLGYFGLYYARENTDKVRAVAIDGGEGCVEPTDETVVAGEYSPLSRPLYMYTDGKPEGVLLRYFEHALGDEGQDLVSEVGYIRLDADTQQEMLGRLA